MRGVNQQQHPAAPPGPYATSPVPSAWNGKTNGFSIASLTLSLLGCTGLLSIIFGVIGLQQSRRNGDRRGRIFAILGLIVSSAWLLGIAIAIAVAVGKDIADGPDRDNAGAIRGERSINVIDLRAGDCIKDLDSQSGRYVDVLPCSLPHTGEVFATFTLPGGPWAGTAKVKQDARAGCDARFASYAGGTLDEDAYFLFAAPPEERDWPENRNVLCIAHRLNGTTTGSLRR